MQRGISWECPHRRMVGCCGPKRLQMMLICHTHALRGATYSATAGYMMIPGNMIEWQAGLKRLGKRLLRRLGRRGSIPVPSSLRRVVGSKV